MNTRQSLRLIAAAAAAANGGKQMHMNGNGAFDSEKGKYTIVNSKFCWLCVRQIKQLVCTFVL